MSNLEHGALVLATRRNQSKLVQVFGRLPADLEYLSFLQAFGLVCSASSNSLFNGRLAYVPALEDVLVWDVKKSQMVPTVISILHSALVSYPTISNLTRSECGTKLVIAWRLLVWCDLLTEIILL